MLKRIFSFYINGFKNMPQWGKTMWLIIAIKLFVMFFVLKLFFFKDDLGRRFDTEEEKADYIIEQITQ